MNRFTKQTSRDFWRRYNAEQELQLRALTEEVQAFRDGPGTRQQKNRDTKESSDQQERNSISGNRTANDLSGRYAVESTG